jgi:glutamate---cysteine ligase / carboxylate-amine ligase
MQWRSGTRSSATSGLERQGSGSQGRDVGGDLAVAKLRRAFRDGVHPTVGLEDEVIIVEPESFVPVDEAGWILAELDDPRVVAELRTAQLELVVPPSGTVASALKSLASGRRRLVQVLDGRARVLAAGTHPTSRQAVRVTDLPRYREIGLEHPWALRRGLPTGLHVHVAVGGPDEALVTFNAARAFLPELAALASNSPFFEGGDTGLASCRLKLTEDLPRAGVPPAFDSWRELSAFLSWGAGGGLFSDASYLWWDLRLRPEYGTLEFRVADSQTALAAAAAVAAVCQSLVTALRARLREGDRLPVVPTHMINENRWRAIRGGLDAVLVDYETGACRPARERLADLLFELEPHARGLRCEEELAGAWRLLATNGAIEQRAVERSGGLAALLAWLVAQSEFPAEPARLESEPLALST